MINWIDSSKVPPPENKLFLGLWIHPYPNTNKVYAFTYKGKRYYIHDIVSIGRCPDYWAEITLPEVIK